MTTMFTCTRDLTVGWNTRLWLSRKDRTMFNPYLYKRFDGGLEHEVMVEQEGPYNVKPLPVQEIWRWVGTQGCGWAGRTVQVAGSTQLDVPQHRSTSGSLVVCSASYLPSSTIQLSRMDLQHKPDHKHF